MSSQETVHGFLVGGRYRNRKGEYEVLEITGRTLRVLYDDGKDDNLDAEVQARISKNMEREVQSVEPYSGTNSQPKNQRFFRSLGFLVSRSTMLEAIVHPRAQAGFVETYRTITGQRPATGQEGYYVHVPSTDKWGNELRVTFTATDAELTALDFGSDINVRVNPGTAGSWRINNNRFWWFLLRMGFNMGGRQSQNVILPNVPLQYRGEFNSGIAAAT